MRVFLKTVFYISILISVLPVVASDLVIKNTRLIDGTGAQPRLTSIYIVDGSIQAVGDQVPVNADEVLDVQGKTVMPGLIDGHVHLQSVPGSAHREDTPERTRELKKLHLRAYLASGVTTVLDTGSSPARLRGI